MTSFPANTPRFGAMTFNEPRLLSLYTSAASGQLGGATAPEDALEEMKILADLFRPQIKMLERAGIDLYVSSSSSPIDQEIQLDLKLRDAKTGDPLVSKAEMEQLTEEYAQDNIPGSKEYLQELSEENPQAAKIFYFSELLGPAFLYLQKRAAKKQIES